MATVLAFLNFKGGVGKTANVVNIAGCLAATHDKRVLVVDLDAQCNASLWLLGKYGYREHTLNGVRTIGSTARRASILSRPSRMACRARRAGSTKSKISMCCRLRWICCRSKTT